MAGGGNSSGPPLLRHTGEAKGRAENPAEDVRTDLSWSGQESPSYLGLRIASFPQKRFHRHFYLIIRAFAGMHHTDMALAIKDVLGRPETILIRLPSSVIVILSHWIVNLILLERALHVGRPLLIRKFRSMHTDHYEPSLFILFIQTGDIRQGANTVDTGVGPKINEHHLASQLTEGHRRGGIEPLGNTNKVRSRSEIRQSDRCGRQDVLAREPLQLRLHHCMPFKRSLPRRIRGKDVQKFGFNHRIIVGIHPQGRKDH